MAQHELSNKEIIVRLLKSDLSDYDNLLSLLGMANEVIREDKELSRKLANKVRFLALRLCATGDIKYYNLYNKALLFLAQEHKDFDSYLLYVEKNRDPEDRYYQPRRNKIYWLVQKMQRLIDDELDILSISMPPGTGKTTLAWRLMALFGEDEVRLISHDSYYKRHDELPFEERCKLNYDHPDAFDNALLIYHLQELKAGRAIDCPVYDYADHNRSSEVQHIEPAPVLIVEGILPLAEPELCSLFDYKIYVDTDADERILRRILRDVKERGRSLDSVIAQYRATVKPMHEAFVEPSKRNADIIIPNGGENGPAIEMLAHHIRSLIQKANLR